MPNRDYHQERREYVYAELNRDQLHLDPMQQFNEWMDEATAANIIDPNAMSLATVDQHGQPDSRVVLLKEITSRGFVFYSHYDSTKGLQIEQNPKASLLFFWPQMDRQIRIAGTIEKVSREKTENYFHSRPRESQIAAACSQQSQIIPGRKTLELNYALTDDEYAHHEVTCPETWGGYELIPHHFEFWQGRANRLHDRFSFTLHNGHWDLERLSP